MKYVALIALVVLLCGCSELSSQGDQYNNEGHYVNQDNPMLTENYTLVEQASDLPGLSSINPAPGSSNYSVTGIISMDFEEDWGYTNFYVGFYERANMLETSFDFTSYDSFYAKDFGVYPMIGLKPYTEYVLRMEEISTGNVYYINYVTGEADTEKPFVESAQTSGTQLELFFNERVDTSTITPENVIVSGKTGDFTDLRVSSHYISQYVYIEFNLSYYESYAVTVKGVKDLSGNFMDEQTLSITARTI